MNLNLKDITKDFVTNAILMEVKKEKQPSEGSEDRGWLTRFIVKGIRDKNINRKKREIEELKLDIEKAKLERELKDVKWKKEK